MRRGVKVKGMEDDESGSLAHCTSLFQPLRATHVAIYSSIRGHLKNNMKSTRAPEPRIGDHARKQVSKIEVVGNRTEKKLEKLPKTISRPSSCSSSHATSYS